MILFLLKGLTRFFCAIPLPVALFIGRRAGWFYGHVIRYHRKDALSNVAECLPEKTPDEVRGIVNHMYLNLGMNLIESFRCLNASKEWAEKYINIVGEEYYETIREGQKGCVSLMGHLGNWELLGGLCYFWEMKISVIVKALKPEEVNDYIVKIRSKMGLTVLNRKKAFRPALRSLRNKEIVAFILDQNVTRSEGVFVDFFGKPACTSTGLAYLAIKTGAPIMPTFSFRKPGGHHEVILLPPIYPPSEISDENVLALTQECTSLIEQYIRKYPEQWIWLHRRWRTTPDEGASIPD